MNGDVGIKKAAMNKVKQVANVATGSGAIANGNKKRRKGQDLKPIITGEQQNGGSPSAPVTAPGYKTAQRYFYIPYPSPHLPPPLPST